LGYGRRVRRCSAWGTGLTTVVALSALACGGGSRAAQPPPRLEAEATASRRITLAVPAAARSVAPRDTISVLGAAQVPASLQVDGKLTEWPVLAGGNPTPLTPSFVVVTATADAVVLAGRVRDVSAQGLWLRLETDAPDFPPIGSLQRGGGIVPLQCEATDDTQVGAAPFDADSCRSILAGYEQLEKSYAASFVRQLHLTTQALSQRVGAQEQPLAAAKYAFLDDAGVVTFEAVLPLSALPRTLRPDLSGLSVVPERAVSGAPSDARPKALQGVSFARPIQFGIDSELLSCLVRGTSGVYPTTPRYSYQPGLPNRVFSVANVGGFQIQTDEFPLSTTEGGLGALEVRLLQGPQVAVFKAGELIECTGVGDVLGVIKRGRGLHVIGYNQWQDEAVGYHGAEFKVLEIEPDGTLHDDLLEAPERGFAYAAVGQEHAKNLTSFSISGIYQSDEGGSQDHTLSWRYDARLNRYALRVRNGRYVPPNSSE
jgi:hypothetical protein